jgi:hypothetical protein
MNGALQPEVPGAATADVRIALLDRLAAIGRALSGGTKPGCAEQGEAKNAEKDEADGTAQ